MHTFVIQGRFIRSVKLIRLIVCAVVLLSSLPLFGQDNSAPPPPSSPPSPSSSASSPGYRGRREGCWQVAGIPRSVAEQGREIERNAHSQVQGVCSNSSLTPQERQQQLRQIHQTERQQLEGLVSAQQLEAFRSCRQERGHGAGMGGGCGNMAAPQGANNGSNNGSMPAQDDPSRQ